MRYKPLPPLEVVQQEIEYNSETGEFTYKLGKQGRYQRSKRDAKQRQKYRRLRINGEHYVAHRIAWLLHHGEDPGELVVDHISGDKTDNSIANLRIITAKHNTWNRHARGLGVTRRGNGWTASVTASGTRHWISDKCPLLAHTRVVQLRRELHGEFAT